MILKSKFRQACNFLGKQHLRSACLKGKPQCLLKPCPIDLKVFAVCYYQNTSICYILQHVLDVPDHNIAALQKADLSNRGLKECTHAAFAVLQALQADLSPGRLLPITNLQSERPFQLLDSSLEKVLIAGFKLFGKVQVAQLAKISLVSLSFSQAGKTKKWYE